MPDHPEATLAALEALVDTLAPQTDAGPGGAALGVHRHVADSIDAALPGFLDMLVMLLDAYAAEVRAGAAFADLEPEERDRTLRAMAVEESQDMREIVGALFLFTYGGMYSEWSGYDRATGRLDPPWTWSRIEYRGPVRGNPAYRGEAAG